MSTVGTLTLDQAVRLITLGDDDPDVFTEIYAKVDQHLAAGKGMVIYRNEDLSHLDVGHCLAFTYGTPEAQFVGDAGSLPDTMPDGLARAITGGTGWRYRLHAVVPPLEA